MLFQFCCDGVKWVTTWIGEALPPGWWNWQTRQLEVLVRVTPLAGSNPVPGIRWVWGGDRLSAWTGDTAVAYN